MPRQPEFLPRCFARTIVSSRSLTSAKALRKPEVDPPAGLMHRRQELAVGPEVILVDEDDLSRVEHGMNLQPRPTEHDDGGAVALEDHPPVVVGCSQPDEAKALSWQGRLLQARSR